MTAQRTTPEIAPRIIELLKESASNGTPWVTGSDLAQRAGVSALAVSDVQAKMYNTIIKRQDKGTHRNGHRRNNAFCLAPDLLKYHMGWLP
jgi:hypothetical protein